MGLSPLWSCSLVGSRTSPNIRVAGIGEGLQPRELNAWPLNAVVLRNCQDSTRAQGKPWAVRNQTHLRRYGGGGPASLADFARAEPLTALVRSAHSRVSLSQSRARCEDLLRLPSGIRENPVTMLAPLGEGWILTRGHAGELRGINRLHAGACRAELGAPVQKVARCAARVGGASGRVSTTPCREVTVSS